jgi:hypothetical protein
MPAGAGSDTVGENSAPVVVDEVPVAPTAGEAAGHEVVVRHASAMTVAVDPSP